MGLGYVGGMTHDYVRHGTTTLFAALDIATGAVFTECKPRHRHQEFLISAPPFCGAKGDRIIFGIHVYFSDAGFAPGMVGCCVPRTFEQFHHTELLQRDAAPVCR